MITEDRTTPATPTPITPEALLSILVGQPQKLFSGDDESDLRLYRRLAREMHPDIHPDRAEAFKHLSALRRVRDQQVAAGSWAGGGVHEIRLNGGKRLRVRFLRRVSFELGTLLVCRVSLVYLVREEHRTLFQAGVERIQGLRFANEEMRAEMARYLPQIELQGESDEGPVLVLRKTPDVLRLRDVLDHFGGRLDPRHVTWILSAFHNIGAYLHWAGLTHNALDLDTCFISPKYHSGLLLGGWWYARESATPLTHLPGSSAALWKSALPASASQARRATPALDREMVRHLGRCLLGDPGGSRLLRDPAIPRPLAEWVMTPGAENGIEDYRDWTRVRDGALGPRRFTPMDLAPDAVYGAS